MEQLRSYSSLGRTDVAFVTTVQGAALAIIGDELLALQPSGFLLSAVAAIVALIGFNAERRLYSYMSAYMTRAREIEAANGLSLLTAARNETQRVTWLTSNTNVFRAFYCLSFIGWVLVWILNA